MTSRRCGSAQVLGTICRGESQILIRMALATLPEILRE